MIEQVLQVALQRLSAPEALPALALLLVTSIFGRFIYKSSRPKTKQLSEYPLFNGRKPWSLFITEQKTRFAFNAKGVIEEGLKTAGKIFRLQTDDGIQLVFSPEYADDLREVANLNFRRISAEDYHSHIPGFEPYKQGTTSDKIFHNAIKLNMTSALSQLNIPLAQEATDALQRYWGDNKEWTEVVLKPTVLNLVSQLSARVFVGLDLCRNEDWLRLTRDYSIDGIKAGQDLRLWPKVLRPYVHWFIPSCRKVRQEVAECRALVNPVQEKRNKAKAARVAAGLEPEEHLDAIEWLEQSAKGRHYEPATSQLMLSMAGNFSGSDALTQVIFDLCEQPQLVEELRKEIIMVMKESQWNKSTIYKLRLMDSVLKESQRMKPAAVGLMRRQALEDTTLPDGTHFPKGSKLMVSAVQSWDEKIFPEPMKFDGYRFLRMRESGKQELAQFVSTTPSTLGFGHGEHACPGRFFASNELKIALSLILLKYDFKLAPDTKPKPIMYGLFYLADDTAKVLIKRRTEEIEL